MTENVRLLFIDDDPAFSRLVSKALLRHGFEVTAVPDGNTGLQLLEEQNFDCIALDHYMPGRSGISILESVVESKNAPPVVYVTGADEGRVAISALKAGASDYVLKDSGETFFELLAATLYQAMEAARTIREREEANNEVRIQRDRAEMLLREMNHRVANSLAMVSSLAHIQAANVRHEEAAESLQAFQRRVSAISQVHKRLYASGNAQAIDLDLYLTDLVSDLEQSLISRDAHGVNSIRLNIRPSTTTPDKAVTIGVILTELVTNACKYAYPARHGEVRISLSVEEDSALLIIEDDGVGLDHTSPNTGTGLGTKVVAAMSRTLRGHLTTNSSPRGTRIQVSFQP